MAKEDFMLRGTRADDLRFYEERARQERAAASAATKPEARSAHELLAIEYEDRVRELRDHLDRIARAEN